MTSFFRDGKVMKNELMGSNHLTTNLVFLNFFYEFFSVLVVEKENKLFYWTKLVVFFNLPVEKNHYKFSSNKILRIRSLFFVGFDP